MTFEVIYNVSDAEKCGIKKSPKNVMQILAFDLDFTITNFEIFPEINSWIFIIEASENIGLPDYLKFKELKA